MKVWKLGLMCAAVLFTASINAGAFAQGGAGQPPPGGFGGGRGGFGGGRGGFGGTPTLSNMPLPYLTWALNLTDEQKTKVQAVQEKTQTDMRTAFQPDGSGQPPDRTAMMAKMKEINDQAKTDIEAILTDAQKKKTDVALKNAGIYNTAGIPLSVVPDLKLTADQSKKLAEVADAATKDRASIMKDMQDARQSGDQQKMQEVRAAMQTANKATQDKAQALLTEDQKAAIEKYNKEHPRRGPGGRQPGAGAGNA